MAHSLCTTERAQSNGLTEKLNGVLVDRLAAFVMERPEKWDRFLPAAIASLNTSVQVSTKFSPFHIIFGFCPVLAIESRFPWPEEEWKAEVERAIIWQDTRANIERAQAAQKLFYDQRHRATPIFLPGELGLVRRIQQPAAGSKKFRPRYIGPSLIVQAMSKTTYQVPQNWTRERWSVFPAHVAHMKRFFAPTTARQYADRDLIDQLPHIAEEETEGLPPLPLAAIGAETSPVAVDGLPTPSPAPIGRELEDHPPLPPLAINQKEVPVVGRGLRVRTRPAWWKDYVVDTAVQYR